MVKNLPPGALNLGMISPFFLLSLVTGALWAGLTVLQSRAANASIPVSAYMGFGSLLASVLLCAPAAVAVATGHPIALGRIREALPWIAVSSLSAGGGFVVMQHALAHGPHISINSIAQSALVFPFLTSVLLFSDHPSVSAWSGIAVIVTGIAVSGLASRQSRVRPWFLSALGCCLLLGLSQTLNTVPSKLGLTDPAQLRPALYCLIQGLFHLTWMCFHRPSIALTKTQARFALTHGLTAGSSLALLFIALDLAAPAGRTGLVFPIALGAAVVCFAMYRGFVMAESIRSVGWVSLGCHLFGLGLLFFGSL